MGLFSRKNSRPAYGNMADGEKPTNGLHSQSYQRPANASPAANASLPDIPLPPAPDPNIHPASYLRSIYAVRERSKIVLESAKRNQLRHFTVDMSKFQETAQYVVSIIKVSIQPSHRAVF